MKLYCNKCYAKTEYKFSKPKFCPECGEKVSGFVDVSSARVEKPKENLQKLEELKVSRVAKSKNESVLDEDELYLDDEDQNSQEDYVQTQRSIENFKRNGRKSGVVVEKSDFNAGISFGELMQKTSNRPDESNDFKNLNSLDNKKTKKQILEEFKAESSSEARIVDIN